MPNNVFFCQHH